MKRTVSISVDQLYRRQPGGIGTYVRGLVEGLASLEGQFDLVGVAPRGAVSEEVRSLPLQLTSVPVPLGVLTRLWPLIPLGVDRESLIVHATSMTGPFAGGAPEAVHSVAMHDLLWRDEPQMTTRGHQVSRGALGAHRATRRSSSLHDLTNTRRTPGAFGHSGRAHSFRAPGRR